MAHKYTKTMTSGTKGVFALDTRGQYIRPAALPNDWKKVRLGIIASISGAVSDNNSPVAETMAVVDYHFNWLMGLSDGIGFPGDVGAGKFIGLKLGTYFAPNLCVGYNGGLWNISKTGLAADGLRPIGVFLDSNTLAGKMGGVGDLYGSQMTDPTATSNNAFGMVLELDCTTDNQLAASMLWTANCATDDATLTALLSGTLSGMGSVATGAWWTSSVPTNVSNFFIRWPLSLNRFQILNSQFEQLV